MTKEELFKDLKAKHPDWSDEQIWTQVSIMISAGAPDGPISRGGADVNPTEEIIRIVLEKAKEWLFEVLPDIFMKVADFFTELIDSLPDWAKNGLSYAFRLIARYFGNDNY